MREDRVDELLLHIRAPAGQDRGLRSSAEGLARRVLERCAERLEQRSPGRLVFLSRLPVHWNVSADRLDDPELIARLADELARFIENQIVGRPVVEEEEIAVFEDEIQWRASYLRNRARGVLVWYHAALAMDDDPLGLSGEPDRSGMTSALLNRLAAEGALVEVLAAWPAELVNRVARKIGIDGSGEIESAFPHGSPGPTARDQPQRWHEMVPLRDFVRSLPPGLSRKVRAVALLVQARRLFGQSIPWKDVSAALESTAGLRDDRFEIERLEQKHRPSSEQPVTPNVPEPTSTHSEDRDRGELAEAGVATRYGGLFYLIGRVLELDLGELLWKACLPEGDVLACAMSGLLGSEAEDDPAASLFGGVPRVPPMPSVSPEQQREVSVGLLAALAAALPRRGLASLPEVRLSLGRSASGRCLLATAEGNPFVLFAWPLAEPREAEAGLRAFLSVWPPSSPLVVAEPLIAEIDPTARVRPRPPSANSPPPFRSGDIATPDGALGASIIGCVGYLFAVRAGLRPLADARDLVASWLTVPATVRVETDVMTVTMAMNAINLDLRRSGLDQSPGWVPWLERSLQIVFSGGEPEPSASFR